MGLKTRYVQGLDMKHFKHLSDISCYNHNYYVGFDGDLLFAESDEDNTTEWYIADTNKFRPTFTPLGESYSSEGNLLHIN